jgi:hypothetical protein
MQMGCYMRVFIGPILGRNMYVYIYTYINCCQIYVTTTYNIIFFLDEKKFLFFFFQEKILIKKIIIND